MTTIVCKKTNGVMEIVADKQSTGGHNLRGLEKTKLYKISLTISSIDTDIVFGIAGDSIHNTIVEGLLNDKSILLNSKTLHHFGLKLHKLLMEGSGMKETDIHLLIATKDQCITISNAGTVEDMDGMIAIGSGFILAQGIHLGNPDLDIQKYIPLISTKDEKTSSTFDYIKL